MPDTGKTVSYWMGTSQALERPPLSGDARADVCVIGAGIAGLSTAYELARAGRDVVVLEAKHPGAGETGRTTAHLANAMDDRFVELERVHGEAGARIAAESHGAAIDRIEAVAAEEGIACEFRRVDGWLFLAAGAEETLLDRELEAARRAGLEVERHGEAPLPFATGPALRFAGQGEVHPLRYLHGLVAAIERLGGRIHGQTHALDVDENDDGCRIMLRGGGEVACSHAVLATNSPARHYLTTAKMLPYRTFAIAARAPGGVPRGLYWDTGDPYHYIRLAGPSEAPVLIVGGADHQTGTSDDGDARLRGLEEWTRERFPGVGEVTERWSGQVLEPADFMAFIGRAPGSERVALCTGDSGQGITHGVIAGMLLRDLIVGRKNPWADLYAPSRVRARAAREYVHEGVSVGRHYLDWLLPGEVEREEDVTPGHGAVLRSGLKPVAVYRDPDGTLHRRTAVCTHMGCVVHWNSTEGSWDCPCHGSRFDPEGGVLNGPATRGLDPA
ncbi:MAG TPA: FAD-dependent oxidoreductase [Longimicrobiales bacterium]|nr:FAD-dependent oxidoreductase [Longimicrobiales bacterium]